VDAAAECLARPDQVSLDHDSGASRRLLETGRCKLFPWKIVVRAKGNVSVFRQRRRLSDELAERLDEASRAVAIPPVQVGDFLELLPALSWNQEELGAGLG